MAEQGPVGEARVLDRDRLRELFDIRGQAHAETVGEYAEDPHPRWRELREQAAVHPGTLHELTGFQGPVVFQGLPFEDRPHFTAFTFAACDDAFRDTEVFASSLVPVDLEHGALHPFNSMLSMGGSQHRRYRGLVQPSFVVPRMAWWRRNWIEKTVHELIDGFADNGEADLNVDFCAALPMLTITGSFGVDVEQALAIREALMENQRRGLAGQAGGDPTADRFVQMVAPIVEARRASPEDDLISVLVTTELKDDKGHAQRLTDREIYSFANLLLHAGSGTTWRQMGIALVALLQRPAVLDSLRQDRQLLRKAVDEAVRWMPTDPMFSRFVMRDVDFHGVSLPEGSVLHLALAAGSRDPARWERPDEFDVTRPLRPSLGFGGGAHICLGMHLARTEMEVGIGALLDRLPNLRLDTEAEQPRIVGMYHRGPTTVPVRFG